ncbi:hypothetical protein PsorP6_005197 [Peronosclerospora sorghi]|uniref:Uncharacterized protein n=1 Tax=Peronosclerospora sorghi TaxID=230839 RepID=A0ACC0W6T3_9STRA|nr:hypothetical protein PsorP6_005197 [Peronosclerospora sorghi]
MLYKEETARWLENHKTRSVNGEREARDELKLFEPVEEEHESLADDTMYDDDALTTCSCPMMRFQPRRKTGGERNMGWKKSS